MLKEGQPPTENPFFSRELSEHEKILVAGAQKLAREISRLESEPEYPGVKPRALLVGGFVRDSVLGLHPKDADLEVSGVSIAKLKEILERIFGKVKLVGEAFQVFTVFLEEGLSLDISIPRTESKVGTGHNTGFKIHGDPTLSPKAAAKRRDFTVNSMTMDPLTGEIVDPYNGLQDMKDHLLRITDSESFADDALRIMRAFQFAGRLNFQLEPRSFELIKKMVADRALEVESITPERVGDEWDKLMSKAEKPSVGLELMKETGFLEKYYPELFNLIGCDSDSSSTSDLWNQTKIMVDEAAKILRREGEIWSKEQRRTLMFGSLCLNLGKPIVVKRTDDKISFAGHEKAGIKATGDFFGHFAFTKELKDKKAKHNLGEKTVLWILTIVNNQYKPLEAFENLQNNSITERKYLGEIHELLKKIDPLDWRVFLATCEAGYLGQNSTAKDFPAGRLMAETIAKNELDKDPKKPFISGPEIKSYFPGRADGRWIGDLISQIEAARDNGDVVNKDEASALLRKIMEEKNK